MMWRDPGKFIGFKYSLMDIVQPDEFLEKTFFMNTYYKNNGNLLIPREFHSELNQMCDQECFGIFRRLTFCETKMWILNFDVLPAPQLKYLDMVSWMFFYHNEIPIVHQLILTKIPPVEFFRRLKRYYYRYSKKYRPI